MSCWSAKSFVSCIARAVEDQGLDSFGLLFVRDEVHEVGEWKKTKKEKIGIAHKKRVARCLGDVLSIEAPNILSAMKQQRSSEGMYFAKAIQRVRVCIHNVVGSLEYNTNSLFHQPRPPATGVSNRTNSYNAAPETILRALKIHRILELRRKSQSIHASRPENYMYGCYRIKKVLRFSFFPRVNRYVFLCPLRAECKAFHYRIHLEYQFVSPRSN